MQRHKNENIVKLRRRRIPKGYKQRLKRIQKKGVRFQICRDEFQDLWSENCEYINFQAKKKLIQKRMICNFVQSLNFRMPTNTIFTIYGMITIDENALKYQSKEQSLVNSIFNFYSIVEIQINPNYLSIKIEKNKQNYYPIPYFIERFEAFGDSYFYEMAKKIKKIHEIIEGYKYFPPPPIVTDQQLNAYIAKLQGKPFMLRVSPNRLILSKQLIQLGGKSIQSISQQCLSCKSLVSEQNVTYFRFFMADDYRGQINKFFETFQLGISMKNGQITPLDYLKRINHREKQSILKRQKSLLKVITNKYNLAPGVGCWQVESVLYEEQLTNQKSSTKEIQKTRFVQKNTWQSLSKLQNLIPLPQNKKIQNQHKICSYKDVASFQKC